MADIRRIETTQPPGPRMSRAVVRGDNVYLAGLTASDTSLDIAGQTRQILDKIDHYLKEAGTTKSNLLTANLWIKDMAMFSQMNAVWNDWVDSGQPALPRLRPRRHGPARGAGRDYGDGGEVARPRHSNSRGPARSQALGSST